MMTMLVWMFIAWFRVASGITLPVGNEFADKSECEEKLKKEQNNEANEQSVAYWSQCFEVEKTKILKKSGRD